MFKIILLLASTIFAYDGTPNVLNYMSAHWQNTMFHFNQEKEDALATAAANGNLGGGATIKKVNNILIDETYSLLVDSEKAILYELNSNSVLDFKAIILEIEKYRNLSLSSLTSGNLDTNSTNTINKNFDLTVLDVNSLIPSSLILSAKKSIGKGNSDVYYSLLGKEMSNHKSAIWFTYIKSKN